jgi:hypothetical protein
MKIYRIKKTYASILMGLHGLYMTPSGCCHYVDVNVFDYQTPSYFTSRNRLTRLPKKCDRKLVYDILEQIQLDNATSESVKMFREYLQCAEKKDKNNKIKSDIKKAIKQIFLGLLIIVVGGVGGFGLMSFLMSLSAVGASWASFLLIPIVVALVYGAIKAGVGCLKLGVGIFSVCFRQKNVEQLPMLENELRLFFLQPPSYSEVMRNTKIIPSAPELYSEPPTYQQAVKNSSILPTRPVTLPLYIPALVPLPRHSMFFHPHLAATDNGVRDTPSPISRHCFN